MSLAQLVPNQTIERDHEHYVVLTYPSYKDKKIYVDVRSLRQAERMTLTEDIIYPNYNFKFNIV